MSSAPAATAFRTTESASSTYAKHTLGRDGYAVVAFAEHYDGIADLDLGMSNGAVGRDLALAALDASQHFAKEVHETFDVCDHDVRVDAVVSVRNAARALVMGESWRLLKQHSRTLMHAGDSYLVSTFAGRWLVGRAEARASLRKTSRARAAAVDVLFVDMFRTE